MQLRFRAQDTVQASLVEALIDDFKILGVTQAGSVSLLGGGQRGSYLRINFRGAPGAVGLPLLSTTMQDTQVPGVSGRLRVGFNGLVVLTPFSYGTSASQGFDGLIPNDATLVGKRFHWQQLLARGAQLSLGNVTSVRVQ